MLLASTGLVPIALDDSKPSSSSSLYIDFRFSSFLSILSLSFSMSSFYLSILSSSSLIFAKLYTFLKLPPSYSFYYYSNLCKSLKNSYSCVSPIVIDISFTNANIPPILAIAPNTVCGECTYFVPVDLKDS